MQIKMIKKEGKLPYGKEVFARFDDQLFMETANGNESKIDYANIEKIAVGQKAIYIYIGAIQAFIIPFSVFEDEEKREEFLTFLNHKKSEANPAPQ